MLGKYVGCIGRKMVGMVARGVNITDGLMSDEVEGVVFCTGRTKDSTKTPWVMIRCGLPVGGYCICIYDRELVDVRPGTAEDMVTARRHAEAYR
jgi:hypothetical protein